MIEITSAPLDLGSSIQKMRSSSSGAVVCFEGTVRDLEAGRPITGIHYESYEAMSQRQFERVRTEAEGRWPVRILIAHRIGFVSVSETSLLVIVSAPHRAEAFAACQWVIEAIKRDVPIWKTSFEEASA